MHSHGHRTHTRTHTHTDTHTHTHTLLYDNPSPRQTTILCAQIKTQKPTHMPSPSNDQITHTHRHSLTPTPSCTHTDTHKHTCTEPGPGRVPLEGDVCHVSIDCPSLTDSCAQSGASVTPVFAGCLLIKTETCWRSQ